jgi:hypothetical protein
VNQPGRYDALRAQLLRAQAQAQNPVSAALQRLRAAVRRQPVRNYGSRLRRP